MENKELESIVLKITQEFKLKRKELGLSHQKLAEMTGLHRTAIGLIESNKRMPSILTCLKISDALK